MSHMFCFPFYFSKQRWAQGILNTQLRSVFDMNGFWIGLNDRQTENKWYWDAGPYASGNIVSSIDAPNVAHISNHQ